MTGEPPHSTAQRKAGSLAKLAAEAADVWVDSVSGSDAGPYLVPLSLGRSTSGSFWFIAPG